MKNIPIFTASNGMASLILREIPYSGRAYVMVRAVWRGETAALLSECGQFCRAAGAEAVYASRELEELPANHAYDMVELRCRRADLPLPDRPLKLEPLSLENAAAYLEIYNRCFRDIPGATAYDRKDMERLMGKNLAFLVREAGRYAAVAELDPRGLAGVAVLPECRGLGLGRNLTLSALRLLDGPELTLKTASTNRAALALYHSLGFGGDRITSRWWQLD